jgi:hypothetical protein
MLAGSLQKAPKICEALSALLVGYGRSPQASDRSYKIAEEYSAGATLLRNIAVSA